MSNGEGERPAAWRGPAADGGGPVGHGGESPEGGRVVLLVHGAGNRRQLGEHLRRHYEVIEGDGDALPAEGFDLAVVDGPGFRRWHQQLVDAKAYEEPVFLPVMLVLPRRDLRKRLRSWWDVVDEFVIAPIDREEFTERAAMLLRARRMAVTQRAHLAHIVNHDRSTGLPTQGLFLDRVHHAIQSASILDQRLHVVVVHVPLMHIMKSLGHAGLQRAARACVSRLRRLLEEDYSLARLTTEDWGMLLPPEVGLDAVVELCRRIGRLAEEPLDILGEKVHVAPYIGVGVYPDDASGAESALDCAIGALSQAQKPGEPEFYSRSVQHRALRYIRTEARLYEGLQQEQFELWYQPKVRMDGRVLVGVEALVRWRLPSGQLVPPGDFMAVAEASGVVRQLDAWVVETACRALARWHDDAGAPSTVAVNVTPADVVEPGFEPRVRTLLERHALAPESLELELTETMLCESPVKVLEVLRVLRDLGVRVSVDDFGTGYSSLSYLHRLPVSALKIDKTFVDNVVNDARSDSIARAIVWLADNFDLAVVAEGIECSEQVDYLLSLGVEVGQGFLFGYPMPEPELMDWIRAQPDTARRAD